jgi:MerR family transcriptional regulator, light-induced transcriptional regulator
VKLVRFERFVYTCFSNILKKNLFSLLMKSLTTKEVSRLCHVSDATVKRWEESGVLRSERTNGGHRRFRADEVARFQREKAIGLKACHGDESASSALTRRRENREHSGSPIFHSLVAGREEEVSNILIGCYLNGKSVANIIDETLCPAMRLIGELWSVGKLTIAQEHLATRAAAVAIQKLRSIVPVPKLSGEVAICCALEGDFHELSTLLAQIVFESQGWEVMNFGCNTPLYSLIEEVNHHVPDLICISATVLIDSERAARDYSDFRSKISKYKIPIVIGGKALSNERIIGKFPADLHALSFTNLAHFSFGLLKK